MTPTAFRAALADLGMSASSYAELVNRPRNTVIAWTDDRRSGPPQADADWIARRLAALRSDPPPRAPAKT
jgi:DNA-binding transcriptional regulator YiaG